MIIRICPVCKWTTSLEDANFCAKDGARYMNMPACECGHQVYPNDKFCQECGLSLTDKDYAI